MWAPPEANAPACLGKLCTLSCDTERSECGSPRSKRASLPWQAVYFRQHHPLRQLLSAIEHTFTVTSAARGCSIRRHVKGLGASRSQNALSFFFHFSIAPLRLRVHALAPWSRGRSQYPPGALPLHIRLQPTAAQVLLIREAPRLSAPPKTSGLSI